MYMYITAHVENWSYANEWEILRWYQVKMNIFGLTYLWEDGRALFLICFFISLYPSNTHTNTHIHTQAPTAARYYTAISDYNPGESDEHYIALTQDQEVEVIGINKYGWWWVRATNYITTKVEEGWVPASYLHVSPTQTVPWVSLQLIVCWIIHLNFTNFV